MDSNMLKALKEKIDAKSPAAEARDNAIADLKQNMTRMGLLRFMHEHCGGTISMPSDWADADLWRMMSSAHEDGFLDDTSNDLFDSYSLNADGYAYIGVVPPEKFSLLRFIGERINRARLPAK